MVLENSAPSHNRDYNLSQIFKVTHQQRSISRASLVRTTGLSATTISSIVTKFLESGLFIEVGEGKSSGGRRPILLQLNPENKLSIGVDLGASHIESVLANLYGTVKRKKLIKFDVANNPQQAINITIDQIAALIKEESLTTSDVLGIGIAVPAPLKGENKDLLSPLILPKWENVSILDEINRVFQFPNYIDNDANVGALAENWWGSGQGISNLVYIKLGTGVGSGLIIENEVYRGTGGTAGEIGHTTINVDGPQCRCGNNGCLESYVGTPAILDSVLAKMHHYPNSTLRRDKLSLQEITAAASMQDALALDVVTDAGKNLGIAIANLLNLANPELVVLGGDLVEAGLPFIESVRRAAFGRSISKAANEVTIVVSELKEDVIAIGAATLVICNAFLPHNIRQTLNYTN